MCGGTYGRVNRGDEGEGIWLVGFIYIHEIDGTSCSCFKWGGGRRGRGGANQCIGNWHNKLPLYSECILIKIRKNKQTSPSHA
jgi:hypothetical protein